jgi:hypothetical protein
MQRQLLQCRTCGSQAFHVLDCCRDPDYARVPTSAVAQKLKTWLGGAQASVRLWLVPRRQPPKLSRSAEALDTWEARPLLISKAGNSGVPHKTGSELTMQDVEHDTSGVTEASIEPADQLSNVMSTIS